MSMNVYFRSITTRIQSHAILTEAEEIWKETQRLRQCLRDKLLILIKTKSGAEFTIDDPGCEVSPSEFKLLLASHIGEDADCVAEIIVWDVNTCQLNTPDFDLSIARSPQTSRHIPHSRAPMFFRPNGCPIDMCQYFARQSVFLICNGPSFATIDRQRLKLPGILTFGMNNGGHSFRPDFWIAIDEPRRFMRSIWIDPSIMKFIPFANFKLLISRDPENISLSAMECPNVVGFRRNQSFKPTSWLTEDTVNWGTDCELGGNRSVMLAALRIIHLLGFQSVYLVGCDFQMSQDNPYWFPETYAEGSVKNNNRSYAVLRRCFELLKPQFAEVGFDIYNTNPTSRLEVFPYKPLEEALRDTTVDTGEATRGMYL